MLFRLFESPCRCCVATLSIVDVVIESVSGWFAICWKSAVLKTARDAYLAMLRHSGFSSVGKHEIRRLLARVDFRGLTMETLDILP